MLEIQIPDVKLMALDTLYINKHFKKLISNDSIVITNYVYMPSPFTSHCEGVQINGSIPEDFSRQSSLSSLAKKVQSYLVIILYWCGQQSVDTILCQFNIQNMATDGENKSSAH